MDIQKICEQNNLSMHTEPIGKPSDDPKALKINIVVFVYGSIWPQTHQCILRDALGAVKDTSQAYEFCLTQYWGDALIDRARAIMCEGFLRTDMDVLVMLDYDLEWFHGDTLRIATKAFEMQGIVGAPVAKKSRGQGIASCIADVGVWQNGTDRLCNATYVGSAFTAYPRKIVEDVMATAPMTIQGFRPAWTPMTWEHPIHKDKLDYLSEDWAFCRKAINLGHKCFVDMKPQLIHWGFYPYTIADAFQGIDPKQFKQPPSFSLLHATRGRKEQALATRQLWLERSSGMHEIEYLFSCDNDDIDALPAEGIPDGTRVFYNGNNGCCQAYNRAAYQASNDILIQVHDDLEPPTNWDKLIAEKIGEKYKEDFILHVDDGISKVINPDKKDMLTILIGSRKYFQRIGYFWHPKFASVFCDDHMTAKAKKDNVIIDGMDINFIHHWKGHCADKTYMDSYSRKNWDQGEAACKQLIDEGLKDEPELWSTLQ